MTFDQQNELIESLQECQKVLALLISPTSNHLSAMHAYCHVVGAEVQARKTLAKCHLTSPIPTAVGSGEVT